jgi:hypothetical protein
VASFLIFQTFSPTKAHERRSFGGFLFQPIKTQIQTLRNQMTSAQTWRLRDVAQVAEMKPRALRQCFEIGALKLSGNDKRSTGSGDFVGLSKQTAYHAATMKHLHRLGLSIPHAARAASEFSNVGNIDRAPSELFKHGETILVVGPDSTTVKNIFSDTSLADVFASSPCVIIMDINRVTEQVDTVLNRFS